MGDAPLKFKVKFTVIFAVRFIGACPWISI
jgi:hypothetical protein